MDAISLDSQEINFQPLQESDFHLLHKWLTTVFVTQWYKEEGSLENIKKKYLPRIRGEEKVSCFIIQYGKTPIGYIQTYLLTDYPEYRKYLPPTEFGAGVDLFIGEADYIHKGLGSSILKRFICQ